MRTITMACMDRPEYTLRVLESIRNQTSLEGYKLYINIDTGNCKEVVDICKNIDFIETDIKIFKLEEDETNKRVNENTLDVIRRAYNEGSEFNLYLEDDIIISPDALDLMDWYTKQDLTKISALCLCNILDKEVNPEIIFKTRACCFWGFVTSEYQFRTYFEPKWTDGYCWDSHIARYIRTFDVCNLMCQLSRSTNIGKIGVNPGYRWEKIMKGHIYNTEAGVFDYRT